MLLDSLSVSLIKLSFKRDLNFDTISNLFYNDFKRIFINKDSVKEVNNEK